VFYRHENNNKKKIGLPSTSDFVTAAGSMHKVGNVNTFRPLFLLGPSDLLDFGKKGEKITNKEFFIFIPPASR
jgi:hypothetical protein